MSLRRNLLLALFLGLLAFPSAALAGNEGGPSSGSQGSDGDSCATCGDSWPYWNILGTKAELSWPSAARIASWKPRGSSTDSRDETYAHAVWYFVGGNKNCYSNQSERHGNCPLLRDDKVTSGPEHDRRQDYQVHEPMPRLPSHPGRMKGFKWIIGWNIRIWREPVNAADLARGGDGMTNPNRYFARTPIFERTVKAHGAANITDPMLWNDGVDWNEDWLRGGMSRHLWAWRDWDSGTNGRNLAGQVGFMTKDQAKSCWNNRGAASGNNDIGGDNENGDIPDAGDNTNVLTKGMRHSLSRVLKSGKTSGEGACVWRNDALTYKNSAGQLQHETIRLSWRIPRGRSKNPNKESTSYLKYRITGPSNVIYFVVIAPMSPYEQLIGKFPDKIAGEPGMRAYDGGQVYVRAFIPNIRTGDGCSSNCDAPRAQSTEPEVKVMLSAESSVQVRAATEQTVNLMTLNAGAAGPDNDSPEINEGFGQIVFPTSVGLLHFTPQEKYSGQGVSGSYPSSYITTSDPGLRLPSLAGASARGRTGQQLYLNLLSQPPQPAPDAGVSEYAAQNVFRMMWMKPTLANPCASELGEPPLYNAVWPTGGDFTQCKPSNVSNVWDDFLRARGTWEARWVKKSGTDAKAATETFVHKEVALRCGWSADETDGEQCANQQNNLWTGQGPLADTQYADGYFYSARNKNDRRETDPTKPQEFWRGSAHIRLNTSLPNEVVKAEVWRKNGENPMVATVGRPKVINTVTKKPELHFCKQNLPAGAKINTAGADTEVTASQTGDEECTGLAVKWAWGFTDTYNVDDPGCTATASGDGTTAPSGTSFPQPTAPASTYLWGQYGKEGRSYPSEIKYQTSAWPADPKDPTAKQPPYTGTRPGFGTNDKTCSEKFKGYKMTGHWKVTTTWVFRTVPRNNTTCKWDADQLNGLNNKRPDNTAPDGYLRPCKDRPGVSEANQKNYAFGYWQPNQTQRFYWESTRCEVTNKPATDMSGVREKGSYRYTVVSWTSGSRLGVDNFTKLDPEEGTVNQDWWPLNDPSRWYNSRSCTAKTDGYVTGSGGSWVTDLKAKPGWGANNTGGALTKGPYQVHFTFSGLNGRNSSNQPLLTNGDSAALGNLCSPDKSLGISVTVKACWFLTADYHGLNWNWLSRHANSDNSLDGDKEDFVSAFGTRGNR